MTPTRAATSPARNVTSMARSNITACIRCRQKKKRCDQKLPRCHLCEIAGVDCVGYDAVTKRHVPRSYVHSLEERVAYLEQKLRENETPDPDLEVAPGSSSASILPGATHESESRTLEIFTPLATYNGLGVAARTTNDRIMSLVHRHSEPEPAFSKILLTELMRSKIAPQVARRKTFDLDCTEIRFSLDIFGDLDTSPVLLPTKDATQTLVKAYFQFANLSMPLLHEPTFQQKLELLYSMPQRISLAENHTNTESKTAVFFVFEVLAVALCVIQKQDPSRIPTSMADRYHKTALRALREAGLPIGVEGVQALLLVGQYSYHHPTVWAVWKTIGAALRLAVELGLHRDSLSDDLDFLTIDTMRRTFWVAYAMDRNVSIALAMPSCLSDGVITAKFPSEANDEFITSNGITAADISPGPKTICMHLLRYRQIQSEMQKVLYEKPSPAYPPMDFEQWQQQMHNRIHEWYNKIPRSNIQTDLEQKIIGSFELTKHRALLYLYQPSLNIPTPSSSSLVKISNAATNMIQLYRQFFREHRLTIYWQAVENLFSAGTALMFSYVNSAQVRELLTLCSLESLVHMCSSVLWGMVEHFPAFKGKRDAFDITASEILADLNTSSVAASNREQNHGPQILRPTTNSDSDMDIPQPPFSFSDFDDASFDWGAFENTNEFLTPTWL